MISLKTATVPDELRGAFEQAERELLGRFAALDRAAEREGYTLSLGGERYLLVRAASLSADFFALVEQLYGPSRVADARDYAGNLLFDVAHALGRSDARRLGAPLPEGDYVARVARGPVHFALSGWGRVDLLDSAHLVPDLDFFLAYDHPGSAEADAWLRTGRRPSFPVCIMAAGYSSGWCEEAFGLPLVACEVSCVARGDEHCRFVMAPPERIGERVSSYVATDRSCAASAHDLWVPTFLARKRLEEQLRADRDELEQRVAAASERLQREMAERERVEQQQRQTQRLESLGRLAGGIAHDFNNLLGVIIGYSSILQRRVAQDDPIQSMLGEITEAAQQASSLTRQLVTFSRTQVTKVRTLELNELVGATVQMLHHVLGEDVKLEMRLCAEPARVRADPSQLEQMLMNLAVNARDAMPQGGSLTITTEVTTEGPTKASTSGVRLSVEDTGIGMDEATRAKVFDPFFTTKPLAGGSGLGLSIVYGIVTGCGGTIAVRSAPGQGTRFDILLPAASVEHDSAPAPRSTARPVERRATILLVEDRIALRAMLAQMLEDGGHTVLVAHSPEDAIRIARQQPGEIHVLLTDVVMPVMSGREVARQVRAARPELRVLFISGYAEDPSLLDGDLAGRAAFVRKPVTPTDLARALQALLAGP